jgi:hypothetical protein
MQGYHSFVQSPIKRTRSLYLCPPVTGWPKYTPRHQVPFSSPPATATTTVEVFYPASTWWKYYYIVIHYTSNLLY